MLTMISKIWTANMSKLKKAYEITKLGHPPSFCGLCWKFTEEKMSGVEVKKRSVNRHQKYGKDFVSIDRLNASSSTFYAAKKILKDFMAESKSPDSKFTLEELLYSYIPAYDYQLIIVNGLDCPESKNDLLEEIEKELINREWYSRIYQFDLAKENMDITDWRSIREFGVKSIFRLDDYINAPTSPSQSFCPDHNPNRSPQSRRRYQNDRKRIIAYEHEINKLYLALENRWILKDSEFELQSMLKIAYDNICSTTLSKIKRLQNGGMSQIEIAKILNTSRQAVSIALKREKIKAKSSL